MNMVNAKKWFVLSGVVAVLLIIPRRSSLKADTKRPGKLIIDACNDNEVLTLNK